MRRYLLAIGAVFVISALCACSPFQSGMNTATNAKPSAVGQSYSAIFNEPQPGYDCRDISRGRGPAAYDCNKPAEASPGLDLIHSTFVNLFGRMPNANENDVWQAWVTQQLAAGRSLQDFGGEMVRFFMTQSEFQARYPGMPASGYDALVAHTYREAFGREPSSEESAHWSNYLLTGLALQMHTALAHTDEAFLASNYRALLGRNPDPVGRENFLYYLRNGGDRNAVLREIQSSPERRARYQAAGFFHVDGGIYYSNGVDAFCWIPNWDFFIRVGGAGDLSNVDMNRPGLPTAMRRDGACQ